MLEENKLFVFPYSKYSAKTNMEIDHSLASQFKLHNKPVIRFYGWQPAALSYGYHQKESDFNLEEIKKSNIDIVRRPTGGRAIFHKNELTYSIIVPKNLISKFDLYKKTHFAFSKVIKNFISDVALSKKQIKFGDLYKEKKSAVCFAASARFEVGIDNRKLIGSAQRVYQDALLQHGSIMLSESHLELINFLTIDSAEKQKLKQELELTTTFLDLDHFGLTIKDLSERFLDCIVKEIGFNSIKTSIFEDFNIDLVPV